MGSGDTTLLGGKGNADGSWGAFCGAGRPKKLAASSVIPRLMGGMLPPGWARGDWKRGCGE
jgi:hypothetical protein